MREINSYPILEDKKPRQALPGTLENIVPATYQSDRVIDITSSFIIPAYGLRRRLDRLQQKEVSDTYFPVISYGAVAGVLPAVALESVLNGTEDMTNTFCIFSTKKCAHSQEGSRRDGYEVDLTSYIETVRLSLIDFTLRIISWLIAT